MTTRRRFLAISAAAAAAWGAPMPVAARPDGPAMLALTLDAVAEQSPPEAG